MLLIKNQANEFHQIFMFQRAKKIKYFVQDCVKKLKTFCSYVMTDASAKNFCAAAVESLSIFTATRSPLR